MYVAIDTNRGNDSWLDIYMEGKAEGWVGVGFTHSAGMVSICMHHSKCCCEIHGLFEFMYMYLN